MIREREEGGALVERIANFQGVETWPVVSDSCMCMIGAEHE